MYVDDAGPPVNATVAVLHVIEPVADAVAFGKVVLLVTDTTAEFVQLFAVLVIINV